MTLAFYPLSLSASLGLQNGTYWCCLSSCGHGTGSTLKPPVINCQSIPELLVRCIQQRIQRTVPKSTKLQLDQEGPIKTPLWQISENMWVQERSVRSHRALSRKKKTQTLGKTSVSSWPKVAWVPLLGLYLNHDTTQIWGRGSWKVSWAVATCPGGEVSWMPGKLGGSIGAQ